MSKNFAKPLLLGLSLLSLGACVHTDVPSSTLNHQVSLRNSVQMVRLPHEIKSEEDGTDSLSGVTLASVRAFLSSVDAGYGDIIMIDGPDASPERVKAIETMLRQMGLAYGGQAALGAKPAEGSVVLYVERYVVQTPNCNYWPEVTSSQQANNDSQFHGCASAINLGLMVANPRDLVAGHYSGPSTAASVNALYGPATSEPGPVKTPGSTAVAADAAASATSAGSQNK